MATVCCKCSSSTSLFTRQWTSSFLSVPMTPLVRHQAPRSSASRLSPRTQITIRSYLGRLPPRSRQPRQSKQPTPTSVASTIPLPLRDSISGYAGRLAARPTPTLLYTSVKSGWGVMVRTVLAGGGLIFAAEGFYSTVLNNDTGLSFGALCLSSVWIIVVGVVSVLSFPRFHGNIIQIVAKPVNGGLRLVIDSVPGPKVLGFRTQTVECSPSDLKLASRTLLQQHLPASIPERKRLFEEQRKEKIGRWTRMLRAFDKSFLRQKNVGVQIQTPGSRSGVKQYSMDLWDGSMLDNGKALERLLAPLKT